MRESPGLCLNVSVDAFADQPRNIRNPPSRWNARHERDLPPLIALDLRK